MLSRLVFVSYWFCDLPPRDSKQHELLFWILYRFDIGLKLLSRKSHLKVMKASLRALAHPVIQAKSIFALDSVSVWYRSGNSFPENRIWRTHKQSWELPLRNPSNINVTVYLYRFDIGLTLQSRESNLKVIQTSLRATAQESKQRQLLLWILYRFWYRSEAPIQKIESESDKTKSESYLPPRNPSNTTCYFGFCIGLISVWSSYPENRIWRS